MLMGQRMESLSWEKIVIAPMFLVLYYINFYLVGGNSMLEAAACYVHVLVVYVHANEAANREFKLVCRKS